MTDKRKFLYSACIAYSFLIFLLLPISLMLQGSKAHEAALFVMVTVLFSLPVALGLVTVGFRIFSCITDKVTLNHYLAVFCGALGVSIILSGLANIVGFLVVREISSDIAGLCLYPTLLVGALAAIVYLGFEKWS